MTHEQLDERPAKTFPPGMAAQTLYRRTQDLEIELGRVRIAVGIARLGLLGIANDEALECRCGNDPYTDGCLCPRCFAAETFEAVKMQMGEVENDATERGRDVV